MIRLEISSEHPSHYVAQKYLTWQDPITGKIHRDAKTFKNVFSKA